MLATGQFVNMHVLSGIYMARERTRAIGNGRLAEGRRQVACKRVGQRAGFVSPALFLGVARRRWVSDSQREVVFDYLTR